MPHTDDPSTPRPSAPTTTRSDPPHAENVAAAEPLWNYLRLDQPVRPAEWLLVFGSPDVRVAQRAAELFHAGVADRILVTGGARSIPPGSRCATEAEAFAEVLDAQGVPGHAVAVERLAANTSENFWLSAELLRDLGQDPKDFLVVHAPYAERRVLATAHRRWPDKSVRVTSPQISLGQCLDGELPAGQVLSAIVGEVVRLDRYAHAGLIHLDQPVPSGLLDAALGLQRSGFAAGSSTGTPVAALNLAQQ